MSVKHLMFGLPYILAPSIAGAGPFTVRNPAGKDIPPTSAPPFVHWDLRQFSDCEIPYTIGPLGSGTDDMVGEGAEINKAFQEWENVTPAIIKFREVGVSPTATAALAIDSNNVLFWDNDLTDGDPWDICLFGGEPAMTSLFVRPSTGYIVEIDIVFNDFEFVWNAGVHDDPRRRADVWVVAAHEIGHFCGLGENTGVGAGAEVAETLNDGPFTFPPGGANLTVTINAIAPGVNVDFPAGQRTAAQVAAAIDAAIVAALPPNTAEAIATGSGSVQIQAITAPGVIDPAGVVIITERYRAFVPRLSCRYCSG